MQSTQSTCQHKKEKMDILYDGSVEGLNKMHFVIWWDQQFNDFWFKFQALTWNTCSAESKTNVSNLTV